MRKPLSPAKKMNSLRILVTALGGPGTFVEIPIVDQLRVAGIIHLHDHLLRDRRRKDRRRKDRRRKDRRRGPGG
jgi:hypothetical protein